MSLTADRTPQRNRRSAVTDPITRWLLMVAALVVLMILVGGFVRLSRAGLSIVEWDPVTGVVPPIGDAAWERSFAEYQETPEYQLVNKGMSLGEYQRIFYYEWAHRLIARIAGLLVIVPLIVFMRRRLLTWRTSLPYWGIAALFGIQGAIGWIMVASGLRDRPVVSHLRLTIHLMVAMALLGIALWMALDRMRAARRRDAADVATRAGPPRVWAWLLLATVVLQIAYGGLVAGLKAGYLSNTWPLMFGRLVPEGLTAEEPIWMNLIEPLPSHWIHRWLAFVVAAIVIAMFVRIRRDRWSSPAIRTATNWLVVVVAAQITLGVYTVLLGVPKWVALAHQGFGVALFCIALVIAHQTHEQRTVANPEATPLEV